MKTIVVSDTVTLVVLPSDHTLIISNAEGVIFKCTVCAGTKDVFFHGDKNSYPWMHSCSCGDAGPLSYPPLAQGSDAPHAGGDTSLLTDLYSRLDNCQTVDEVRALFIDEQHKQIGVQHD